MITVEQLQSLGVDTDILLDRCGGNLDLINKLYMVFLNTDAPDNMSMAYATQDADLLEHSSHALKGSAANLGLNDLSKKAAAVCDATRALKTANIDYTLLEDALGEFKRVKDIVSTFDLS